ncbi:MAG: OprO/OprP family phosphate-selective porin [Opitutales bacterium]|nr:OprO/OprP family phosphate-selective porin [Opitutales bacterium]
MKISTVFLSGAALAIAPFATAQETQNVPAPDAASPATVVPAQENNTTKITLEIPNVNFGKFDDIEIIPTAMVQIQYAYADNSYSRSGVRNGFAVRRTTLGATAKMNDGWSMSLVYEFDSGNNGNNNWSRYIDKAIISKKTEYGTLTVGHKKNNFGLEEYSPSSLFPCIERSLNSNFLNGAYAKGLSGYHCGIEWSGKEKEIDYGVSLTNAVARDYDNKSNDLALTYWLGKKFELDKGENVYVGFNGTFNWGNDEDPAVQGNSGPVYGFETYAKYNRGALNVLADVFYVNGATGSANIANGPRSISDFYGLNLTATYKLDCGIEPAARLTYLHTNSGLVNANLQNRVPTNDAGNDMAYTAYLGANYYFNKHVKIAAGYEIGHLYGGARNNHDYGALRTMLQMKF